MADYVDNAKFLAAIKEHKELIKIAAETGKEPPIISNYIGECILKIATHLSYKPNFINYSYRDDMILDGVENCIQYFNNFDADKYSNPFSYFTQIIYYAFLRRIQKEKKHSYIKNKLIQEIPFDVFALQDQDDIGDYKNMYIDYMQSNTSFDDSFLTKKKPAKAKPKNPSLNDFIETDTDESEQQ
jgi:hypothetical protein